MLIRGRFAPGSIGRAMLATSRGRVARTFCGVNDATAISVAASVPAPLMEPAWPRTPHRARAVPGDRKTVSLLPVGRGVPPGEGHDQGAGDVVICSAYAAR